MRYILFTLAALIFNTSIVYADVQIPAYEEGNPVFSSESTDALEENNVDMDETWMATPTCETYVGWMGQHIDSIDLSILGDRRYRVLKPDSMATMDYLPNRLNIHTTDDGIIINQDCG
jgi:hypothetical protein